MSGLATGQKATRTIRLDDERVAEGLGAEEHPEQTHGVEEREDTQDVPRREAPLGVRGTPAEAAVQREQQPVQPAPDHEVPARAVPEPHFRVALEWEDSVPERARDYYYVRVLQQNGQAAWSSPIWVDRV